MIKIITEFAIFLSLSDGLIRNTSAYRHSLLNESWSACARPKNYAIFTLVEYLVIWFGRMVGMGFWYHNAALQIQIEFLDYLKKSSYLLLLCSTHILDMSQIDAIVANFMILSMQNESLKSNFWCKIFLTIFTWENIFILLQFGDYIGFVDQLWIWR